MLVLGVCALLAGCATQSAKTKPSEDNDDGLELVPTSLLQELYVAPGVPLANYKRVMLDPIDVSFKEEFRKEHPNLRDHDYEVFRARLASMLMDKLKAELARGGYMVAESPDKDVLRVRASITKADFASPESGEDKRTYVHTMGEMTLRVQAFDGPSGALVARAKDYQQDPPTQALLPADRVSTNVAAMKIIDKWVESIRSALDVAKVSADARKLPQ